MGEIANHDLTRFELLGIGSGSFFGMHHTRVLRFAEESPYLPNKCFVFSTAGIRWIYRLWHYPYSLEIASAADQSFEGSIVSTLLARTQHALGEVNDTVVRIRYLRKYRNKLKDQESQLFLNLQIAKDQDLLAERLAQWSQFWTTDVQNNLYGDLITRTF